MSATWSSRAPLTGVIAVVLFVIAAVIGGETPDSYSSSEEVVSFYTDNEGSQIAASLLATYGALFLLFFCGALRKLLQSAEGESRGLPTVAFGGGLVLVVGILLFSGLTWTLADSIDDLEPAAAQAINALNTDLFFPVAVGTAALLIATGVSMRRSGAFPGWLAWAAIVIGVLAVTPVGFFAFLAGLLWILVAGIVLTRSPVAAGPGGPAPSPGPAP